MGTDIDIKRSDFPADFLFGVGTSAYQVEGSWRAEGKGLSVWDTFANRHPDKIRGGVNGNTTVDNYARMKEDVKLLKKMGINSYRFSLSWSRILPGGKVNMGKNGEAINHYNTLIDELLANDIEPFATLYQWDTPNALEEEYMGFLSPKIVDDFVNYAEICFWEFGDRVKYWATINEPYGVAFGGYVTGKYAPGRGSEGENGDPQIEPYTVAYNLLNSHAAAYRKYEEEYKPFQKGKVGITTNVTYFLPFKSTNSIPQQDNPQDNPQDIQAVQNAYDFTFGWFIEPLIKGTWPKSMQKYATTSTPNFPNGRILPAFTADELKSLVGAYDFLGLNYYVATYVKYQAPSPDIPLGYATDCHFVETDHIVKGNNIGDNFSDLLLLLKTKYNIDKEFIITENGGPGMGDTKKTYEDVRNDTSRIDYLKQHINAVKVARSKSINVTGYYVWSFMDSLEWTYGFNLKFGLIYVDFAKNLERYPKKSAVWYRKFLGETKASSIKRNSMEIEQGNEATDLSNKLKKIKQDPMVAYGNMIRYSR